MFEIETRTESEIRFLCLKGRLTYGEAPDQVKAKVAESLAEGYDKLVLDLSELKFVDSTGIEALVASHFAVKEKEGRLCLFQTSEPVAHLLKVTHLDGVLEMYTQEEDLRRSFH